MILLTDDNMMFPPKDVYDKINAEAYELAHKLPVNEEKIPVQYFDYPLTVEHIISVSKQLCENFSKYVLVLPKTKNAEEGWNSNHYCKFTFKVVAAGEHRETLELFRTYKQYKEDTGTKRKVVFVNENAPTGWELEQIHCYSLPKTKYACLFEGIPILVYTDFELEAGEEYEGCGLLFEVRHDKQNTLGKKQVIFLVDFVKKYTENMNTKTLEKMKGKNMDWFVKSAMYPCHHSTIEYSMLVTLNIFHAWTGMPMNLIVMGLPSTGKTKILTKIAACTGEEIFSPGSSSVKGFLPSFHSNHFDSGVFGKSRYKACCNEFFEWAANLDNQGRAAHFNRMKDTLEGLEFTFVSGTGQMKMKMKCDMIAVSNPLARIGRSREYQDIIELYEDFPKAALDRVLFLMLNKDQQELVYKNQAWFDGVMSAAEGKMSKVDYGELLDTNELGNIIRFLKTCPVDLSNEGHLQKASNEIEETTPRGIFSRRQLFLRNIASSYAAIRQFSQGSIDNEANRKIVITEEDIDKAKEFLITVLNMYVKPESKIRIKNLSSMTNAESKIYAALEEHWKTHNKPEDKFNRRMGLHILRQTLGMTESEFNDALLKLVNKDLIITDYIDYIQFLPELAPDEYGMFVKIMEGEQPNPDIDSEGMIVGKLARYGLVHHDKDRREWRSLWLADRVLKRVDNRK